MKSLKRSAKILTVAVCAIVLGAGAASAATWRTMEGTILELPRGMGIFDASAVRLRDEIIDLTEGFDSETFNREAGEAIRRTAISRDVLPDGKPMPEGLKNFNGRILDRFNVVQLHAEDGDVQRTALVFETMISKDAWEASEGLPYDGNRVADSLRAGSVSERMTEELAESERLYGEVMKGVLAEETGLQADVQLPPAVNDMRRIMLDTARISYRLRGVENLRTPFGDGVLTVVSTAAETDGFAAAYAQASVLVPTDKSVYMAVVLMNDGDAAYWSGRMTGIFSGRGASSSAVTSYGGMVRPSFRDMYEASFIGGRTVLPKTVKVRALSDSQLWDVVNREIPAEQADDLGTAFDVYQLQADEHGVRRNALLVNAKLSYMERFAAGALARGEAPDGRLSVSPGDGMLTLFIDSLIDKDGRPNPMAEALLFSAVNGELERAEFNINRSIESVMSESRNGRKHRVYIDIEDLEPMHRVAGAKNLAYRAGARILADIDGFNIPRYFTVAIISDKEEPSVYLLWADDTDRAYFSEVFERMLLSLK